MVRASHSQVPLRHSKKALGPNALMRSDIDMADPARKRLSLPRVLAHASLAMPLAGVGLPVAVYLAPLYAHEVGLGLALTGFLFMLLRFWDIMTDPIMGFLVDRFKSPWGRVRHWIMLSVPVLGLATYFIYMPPRSGASAWYFAGWMLLFYLGFTMLQTSRSAWVSAIASDYDDRSRYFFWAEILSGIFMLLLLATPLILQLSGVEADRFDQVRVMGWLLILSLPVSALLSCIFVPDPKIKGHDGQAASFTPRSILKALSNHNLGRVLGMEILAGTSIAITGSIYLFVAEHIYGVSDGAASGILFLFFIVSMAALPFWLYLSRRTQKHTAMAFVAGLAALAHLSYVLTAYIGGTVPFLLSAVLSGSALGATIMLTRSMTADVIEYELVRTGENRSGLYYALLTGSYKMGSSLALGVGYFIIGKLVGFDPAGGNTPGELQGLLYVFSVLPAILYVLVATIAWRYPLTRDVQNDMSAALDIRGPDLTH